MKRELGNINIRKWQAQDDPHRPTDEYKANGCMKPVLTGTQVPRVTIILIIASEMQLTAECNRNGNERFDI